MRSRPVSRAVPRGVRLLLGAATFIGTFALWVGLLGARPWLADARGFDGVTWELASFPGKWLYHLGAPLRDDPHGDEAVREYFALPDREVPAARSLERPVESLIEGRLDAVLQRAGFRAVLGRSVWPPVAIELTEPPRMLAVSPRDRIRLARTMPLDDLGTAEAERLEREVEAEDPDQRAIVVPLGGISTYPAIVTAGSTYAGTVQVAAHEWVHHYFAFTRLGWASLVSRESLAINETAADIAGAELARLVLDQFGDPAPSEAATAIDAQRSRADRDALLRDLRREVDTLLAEGRIDDAERHMESARQALVQRGFEVRRINQAFFAWYGTYAARGDSIDPLGVQLRQLRAASESLPDFLATAGRTTSRAAVEAALRQRGIEPGGAPR
ncbi:MAG: hypothetical protein IT299_12925 [Dehalococcoidia bacterium]|nr:hypothetical protein [Dehalococcoidia bacterium]